MVHVVYSPRYAVDLGDHVFAAAKFGRARERLLELNAVRPEQFLEPEMPERALLERVHTREYLDDFYALRATPRVLLSELPIDAAIRDASVLSVGGTLLACERALEDGACMHLGGGYHHAMPDHAEGFCYLHDVAVALRALLDAGRIQRAAVIDTDVHQGNGTARIFAKDPDVFTFSIHQENNYPIKERSDLDIGLEDGVGDTEYLQRLEEVLPTILDGHRPELVVMVAGADPYVEDLLGGLSLSLEGLRTRDHLVVAACRSRRIPVVGVTAGGYARRFEDTVTIHTHTALEILAAG